MNSRPISTLAALSLFAIFLCSVFLCNCTTPRVNPNMQLISEKEYEAIISKYSDKKQVYDGLYAVMDVLGTLLNSKVQRAQLDQNARLYQWNQYVFNTEKSKQDTKMEKETEIFLSFFSPERKHDDLAKTKTLWKFFLDTNGRRYEGRVTRLKTILAEVVALYPQHNRWSTPYKVSFPIPISAVENNPSTFTITGPAGSAILSFKEIQK